MSMRLGPGPVFIHESIAATRRWQLLRPAGALRDWAAGGARDRLARRLAEGGQAGRLGLHGKASSLMTVQVNHWRGRFDSRLCS